MLTKAKKAVCAGHGRGLVLVLVLIGGADRGSELVGGNCLTGLPVSECNFHVVAKFVAHGNDIRIDPMIFTGKE